MFRIAILMTVILLNQLMAEEQSLTLSPVMKEEVKLDAELGKIHIQKVQVNLAKVRILHKAEDNDFTAYVYRDDSNVEHVLYQDKSTQILYEIANIPMPHRYFSDLVFTAPGILNFNRWSTPHLGMHYEFNLHSRIFLGIEPIADESYKAEAENNVAKDIDPSFKSWLGTYTYRESAMNFTETRSIVSTYCIDVKYKQGVLHANQYTLENSDVMGVIQHWNVNISKNKIIFTYDSCTMLEGNSPC